MSVPGGVRLVAGREIRERLKSRSLKVSTLVSLLLVCGGIAIPALRTSPPRTYDVGIVGEATPALRTAIVQGGSTAGGVVRLITIDTGTAAEAGVDSGALDVAVISADRIAVGRDLLPTDTSRHARLTRAIGEAVRLQVGLEREGLPSDRAAAALRTPPPAIVGLAAAKASPESRATSFFGIILLYMLLVQYGAWVLSGVVEEKASRVVEVLLATLHPRQLLVGKITGIGLVALSQALLLVGAAIATAIGTGTDLLRLMSWSSIAVMLAWFLLGYAFYCCLYAAAGSLVSRQEDAQNVAFPVTIPLLVGYVFSIGVLTSGDASTVARALGWFPPTAPFLNPVLYAVGEISLTQMLGTGVVMVVAIALVARSAAAIYARAVLRTGSKLRWRHVLRLADA